MGLDQTAKAQGRILELKSHRRQRFMKTDDRRKVAAIQQGGLANCKGAGSTKTPHVVSRNG
jgi:hypothetical protein